MPASALSSLQLKIMTIGTALFFSEQESMLPFRGYVVTALKSDEEGNLWFFISRGWNTKPEYDRGFPVNLDFYRKGYPCSISVKGQAFLVNDDAIIHHFMQDLLGKSVQVTEEAMAGVLLVKVKSLHVTSKDLLAHKQTDSLFKTFVHTIKHWLNPFQPSLQPSI